MPKHMQSNPINLGLGLMLTAGLAAGLLSIPATAAQTEASTRADSQIEMSQETPVEMAAPAEMATFVEMPAPVEMAAPGGIMICTKKLPNGNYDGESCHTTVPSYPCSEVQDLCEGCGCWDVSSMIDPNSTPPGTVGKPKGKAPSRKERRQPSESPQ